MGWCISLFFFQTRKKEVNNKGVGVSVTGVTKHKEKSCDHSS